MVGTHLAAIGSIHFAHFLLDERVSGFAEYRLPAPAANDIERVPCQPGIVNDARAGFFFEEGLRQQTHEIIPLDKSPVVIKKETAVEIPIPSEADIRSAATDRLDGRQAIFFQHGVRDAVRPRDAP